MKRIGSKSILVFLFLLSSCGPKKPEGLKEYPPDEALFSKANDFYSFLCYKDLDSFGDRFEIQNYFEDQESYYNFIDTIIPAMRERRFERNRILSYEILGISHLPDSPTAWVKVWIESDDVLPFGKVMIFEQRWVLKNLSWLPKEVKAKKATWIEKIR